MEKIPMNLLNLEIKTSYDINQCRGVVTAPSRTAKPRSHDGLTILIDRGIPTRYFCDVVDSFGHYVDAIKFGWGSSLVTPDLEIKIAHLVNKDIHFFFGGTLFEKAIHQGRFKELYKFFKRYNPYYVEISDGTIELPPEQKGLYIRQLSQEFNVLSEVGYKDSQRSEELSGDRWVELIQQDFSAGATKVILEARESGRSGICQSNGALREEIISQIVDSSIPVSSLIFEAPNSSLQSYLIHQFGANVNLANIPFEQALNLESLRLGLRSDTFYARNSASPVRQAEKQDVVLSNCSDSLNNSLNPPAFYDYQI
jgi:phosphosulfolactate synthase